MFTVQQAGPGYGSVFTVQQAGPGYGCLQASYWALNIIFVKVTPCTGDRGYKHILKISICCKILNSLCKKNAGGFLKVLVKYYGRFLNILEDFSVSVKNSGGFSKISVKCFMILYILCAINGVPVV